MFLHDRIEKGKTGSGTALVIFCETCKAVTFFALAKVLEQRIELFELPSTTLEIN